MTMTRYNKGNFAYEWVCGSMVDARGRCRLVWSRARRPCRAARASAVAHHGPDDGALAGSEVGRLLAARDAGTVVPPPHQPICCIRVRMRALAASIRWGVR